MSSVNFLKRPAIELPTTWADHDKVDCRKGYQSSWQRHQEFIGHGVARVDLRQIIDNSLGT